MTASGFGSAMKGDLRAGALPGTSVDMSFGEHIGVRVQHPVSDRSSRVGDADVGGFRVGSDSTYRAAIGLKYAVSQSAAIKFGYRHRNVADAQGDFAYDVKLDGLYIGVGLRL
jgi:opacity protein-like surface antigen